MRQAFSILVLAGVASGFQVPTAPARELVTKYCISCHNQKLKTANLVLDDAPNSAETWEKVIIKLRSRAMPPPGIRRPDNATYDAVADSLETELDRAAAEHVNPGRTASLHRLNRTEYANAVRDLIAVDMDAQAMLPPDEQAYGFDTNAEALAMEPALLDRYIAAAANIARRAVGDAKMPPAFERYGAIQGNSNEQTYLRQTERLTEDFPLGSRGGIAVRHYFPVDAEYVFKIRLQRNYESVIRGLNVANRFEIRVDGNRVGQFTLGGGGAASQAKNFLYDGDETLQVRVPVKAGLRRVVATMLKSEDAEPEGAGPDRIPTWSRESDNAAAPAAISSLLVGGPYEAKVPQDSPSRRLIFVCQPNGASEETPCAAKILTRLARRAYRRAATSDDVETLLRFYKQARAAGTFDDGIRAALERTLVSPDFLFRIEADPAGVAPGQAYPISDVELASRLSFALWSSIPDDTLLGVAISGKLRDPAVLEATSHAPARRPARAGLAGAELLRGMAADSQRAAAESGEHQVSLVRRQPPRRFRERDRAVPRRAAKRRPQHRQPAHFE